jgi:hypothetical protein
MPGERPVPTHYFPASRELYREFHKWRPFEPFLLAEKTRKIRGLSSKFPTQKNRELFSLEQGI